MKCNRITYILQFKFNQEFSQGLQNANGMCGKMVFDLLTLKSGICLIFYDLKENSNFKTRFGNFIH